MEVFQVRNPILDFFLLVLGVSFDVTLNVIHKHSRFSKALPEKSLEFVPNKESGPVTFDLGLMLFLAEINLILEEQNYKKDAFVTLGLSSFEMILILPTELIAFHVQVFIV